MCWTANKKSVKLQIADKEIPVFKVVYKDLSSVYAIFRYTIGKTYRLKVLWLDNNEINIGFHSYIPNVTLRPDDDLVIIEFEGIYLDYQFWSNVAILECVIPIGAQYCVNEKGEVVSNQIKVLNVKPMPFVTYATE